MKIVLGLLKTFFHLLYNHFAWAYDFIAWSVSLGRWKKWVLASLPYLNGASILELGFGPGHLQIALNQSGKMSFGVDKSWEMCRLAYRKLSNIGLSPKLLNSFAQALPFRDECFTQVVATFPTEYILSSNSIFETYRVLSPGGSLVILPVAYITGISWFERFLAWIYKYSGQSLELENHYTDLLIKAGFHSQIQRINCISSALILIIANKPSI